MLEELDLILSLIATAIPLIGVILYLLAKLFKSKRLEKIANEYAQYQDLMKGLIVQAEKFGSKQGDKKKEWVLEQLHSYAEKVGFDYDEDELSEMIEDVIDLTKKVNKRAKD